VNLFRSLTLPLLAYFGPETMMPLASVLAAAGGAFLLFGRSIFGFFAKGLRGAGRAFGLGGAKPEVPVGRPAGRRAPEDPTPASPDPAGRE
jgi:hypothetical protein